MPRCYGDAGTTLRRIPVRDGVGYASLDPAQAACRTVWAGHPVICDQPRARLLVLENGPEVCEVQVHDPPAQPMTVHLRPAPSAVKLGLLPDFTRRACRCRPSASRGCACRRKATRRRLIGTPSMPSTT